MMKRTAFCLLLLLCQIPLGACRIPIGTSRMPFSTTEMPSDAPATPFEAPATPSDTLHPRSGAADTDPVAVMKQFVRNIETFNRLFPQEKVYLHLDNSGYFVGETIYYKAYVVRPDSMCLTNLSRVLYVELVGPFGETVEKQKLKLEDGQAHGTFRLDKLRTDGFYEVRAYTRYMTNWESTGIYSRVVPVFEKPEKEGDYAQRRIHRDYTEARSLRLASRLTDLPSDSTEHAAEDNAETGKKNRRAAERGADAVYNKGKAGHSFREPGRGFRVDFYPEGGQLVRGLTSLVAFAVTAPDTLPEAVSGHLLAADGDTLSAVATLREGRGTFFCTPGEAAPILRLTTPDGPRSYPLPRPAASGCVLGVNALPARTVFAQVTATPDLHGFLLGLSLMHNGHVLYFDTLRLGPEPAVRTFDRALLPAGVSQLTLFDTDGRIRAERLFFIAPDTLGGAGRIRADFPDSTIAPYKKMTLRLHATPGTTLSLAVADAATATNARTGNAATWLLLASDLKGYVRHADYYLESDDAAHRQAADLLMLVQGWRRYDWRTMSGNAPFEKRQPIEDGLYLDGRILPRRLYADGLFSTKKKKAAAANVTDVRLNATLYNPAGEVLRGNLVTSRDGYYAFAIPECTGEWSLILTTKKDDRKQNYVVSVNRQFAPMPKDFAPGETQLTAVGPSPFRFRVRPSSPTDTAHAPGRDIRLGQALVTARHEETGKQGWEITHRSAERLSQLRFDLEAEAEAYYDRGETPPSLVRWLLSKPVIFKEYFLRQRAIGWIWGADGSPLSHVAMLSSPRFLHVERRDRKTAPVAVKPENADLLLRGFRDGSLLPHLEMAPELPIDEFREVYVAFDVTTDRYIRHVNNNAEVIRRDRPFYVFCYPLHMFRTKHKGVRTTRFQGYNVPQAFQMNDYEAMPPAPDFRRTLYWNPCIRTDAAGQATVEFFNNSTCRSLLLSAEGLTPDGRPAVFR